MEIILTGSTGGIGSAIKEKLKDYDLTCIPTEFLYSPSLFDKEYDWLICAHGIIDEKDALSTFQANVLINIQLAEKIKAKNIIFISSSAGLAGNDKFPIYSASKAALNMYAKLKGYYVVCPGATDTPMWRELGLEGKAQKPDEVAKVVENIIKGIFKPGIIKIKNGVCELLT